MYPHHVFNLEPAGTFGMYPICYRRVSGRYFQPEPAMYSRCFCWFPGPLAPSVIVVGISTTWSVVTKHLYTWSVRFEPALNYVVLIPRVLRPVPSVHSISLRCTYTLFYSLLTFTRLTCTPSPYLTSRYRCNIVHSISLRFHILTSRTGVTRTRTD